MPFWIIVVVLFIISFLLSVWSLRQTLKKSREEKHVKEELSRGRVIYQSDSSSESS